ncbi:MAG: HNH endonuclease [Myxococcales bacterium]|nr:HNH endonuclease [Myxococcales bacterium]
MRVLVLTQSYVPHKIVSWERAVILYFSDKVDIIESYDEELRSPSVVMKMPAVVRLRKPVAAMKRSVKFSRMNVFSRDSFRCQYCGTQRRMHELNYDHVVPRHHGGKTTWDNVVASCYPCNGRKANRTPEQAGMKLLRRPYRPTHLPVMGLRFDRRDIPAPWAEWCRAYFVDEAAA